MTVAEAQAETPTPELPVDRRGFLRRHWPLIAICIVFVGLRLPVACRQLPAQDEDYFAVPGLTILRDRIPRIPYMPSRNPQGAFYKADELLFTLPPLYFYWQAAVYFVLGPSTAAARVASLICGVAAILMVHRLARGWLRDDSAALWSAGLYAASRILYFPVVTARPDMLCGALGLGVLLAVQHWTRSQQRRWLFAAGLGVGAAALTHPFAIVPAMQATGWTLAASPGWRARFRNVLILVAAATPVFLLWLLLIRLHPEAFRAQFFNAVLNASGPGLMSRMLLPFQSWLAQMPIFVEHAGGLQAALMVVGVVAATAFCFPLRDPGLRTLVVLTWSAVYLHIASVGSHPTKGYWCYTGALMFICAGEFIARLLTRQASAVDRSSPQRGFSFRAIAIFVVTAAIMLPGAGLRTVAAHLQHWDDINYDAPRFTQELIAAVPADAKLVVDNAYVFEFYRAGRDTTLALDYEFFFSARGTPYNYVVAGRIAIRDGVPHALDAVLVGSYGDKSDPFACYAEIYAAPDRGRVDELPDK